MKKLHLMGKIAAVLLAFLYLNIAHAGTPVWTLTPLTPTTISVPSNSTATVKYQVTNQSKHTHSLQMSPITGINQVTSAGNCSDPFVLGYQQSCTLTLQVIGSELDGPIEGGPVVCETGNALQCYRPSQPNNLNISQEYTVGGAVSGLIGGTLVLQNNGGNNLSITANGNFTFSNALSDNSSYNVTVLTQPIGQVCTVNNGSGTIHGDNVTNITVSCTRIAYTVGGTVSGLVGSVTLVNNGADDLVQNADGSFTFSTPVPIGGTYNVTVKTQPATQTCVVANATGIITNTNVTNVTVTCLTNMFTVGGNVSGLIGTVTLVNNGGDPLVRSSDGNFTFSTPIAQGSPYNVTVQTQPGTQTCTVSNGSGIMGSSNVTNVQVTCSTNAFSVGGSISGLTGTVVLLNNGGDNLSRSANGSFTFTTLVAQGSPYNVTVGTQPSGQTCTVSNGSGTMGSGPVTNVQVTCSTNSFSVGGSISGLTGTVVLLNNGGDNLSRSVNGSFTFSTLVAQGSPYNVTVGTQPSGQTCTVTNGSGTMGGGPVTNVQVTCAGGNTTLTVPTNGTIPVQNGTNTFTVHNSGSNTATNVHAVLPGAWTTVTQDSSNCVSIAPSGNCNLVFSSTTPFVAQGSITVTGDNITSPPTTALAFTMSSYLVWAVGSSNSASVVDNSNLTAEQWGNNVVTGAQNPNDGFNNTQVINGTVGIGASAAVNCFNSTAGGASVGSWYLPAICQLTTGAPPGCTPGTANIETNLLSLGFTNLANSGNYWSSREASTTFGPSNPANTAWIVSASTIFLVPNPAFKSNVANVRCVRSLSY